MSTPFSTSPTTKHAFTPLKKETMNIRELFLTYLHENGWTLDTNATVALRRGERVQNPHAFVRRAVNGGTWHLTLDYVVEGGYSYRTDNMLRGLRLRLEPGTPDGKAQTWRMENTARTTYDPYRLWEVTGRDIGNDTGRALRMRAERIAVDPDLAVFLAMEKGHNERVEHAEQQAKRDAEFAARSRAVPDITVSKTEWRELTYTLKRKAEALHQANGLSNVHELYAQLEEQMRLIDKVIAKGEPA